MLATMRERSFVVTTAYIKTEPVQVALFGLIVLGEHLTGVMAAAILIATAGVMLMSWPKKGTAGDSEVKSWRPALLGLVSAMFFAFSAIGYRGGIIRLDTPSFVTVSYTHLDVYKRQRESPSNAEIAAISSMRLLVVSASPPHNSFSFDP